MHGLEPMERIVGKRMYLGLLKTVARVWDPKDAAGARLGALYQAILASVAGLVHVLFPGVMHRVSQLEESRSSTG